MCWIRNRGVRREPRAAFLNPGVFRWARSDWLRVHLTRDDHTNQTMFQALAQSASVQGNIKPSRTRRTIPFYASGRREGEHQRRKEGLQNHLTNVISKRC